MSDIKLNYPTHHKINWQKLLASCGRVIGGKLADLLVPPSCLGCTAPIEQEGGLCPECWPRIRFITPPFCRACGHVFEYGTVLDDNQLCLTCLASAKDQSAEGALTRSPLDLCRAALVYDDASRALILPFKHGDRTELAKIFAKFLYQFYRPEEQEADFIIPMPLHWRRLFKRRYNQAALIAHEIAHLSGQKVLANALIRHRATPYQGQNTGQLTQIGHPVTGRRRRELNVAGAFKVNPRHCAKLANKVILIIDDVYTTGASLRECARTLKAAGAEKVIGLTVARVVPFADPAKLSARFTPAPKGENSLLNATSESGKLIERANIYL
ncbi:MAG: ComF family protein [Alphaproteobacteria bacterium]|nr:ComF family protein [Alphaproteobacteria bacterium]